MVSRHKLEPPSIMPADLVSMPKNKGRSSNEDDNDSFHSCVADHVNSTRLFDQDDLDQFPPNTCTYTVNDPRFKPSWSWVPYSHIRKTTYPCCLGVSICPKDGCMHVSNAALPNSQRKKNSTPKLLGSGLCSFHKCSINHIPCNVECTLNQTSTSTKTKQVGTHHHCHPNKRKASKKALQWLHDIVKVSSD
jgi:hypothetical protein